MFEVLWNIGYLLMAVLVGVVLAAAVAGWLAVLLVIPAAVALVTLEGRIRPQGVRFWLDGSER